MIQVNTINRVLALSITQPARLAHQQARTLPGSVIRLPQVQAYSTAAGPPPDRKAVTHRTATSCSTAALVSRLASSARGLTRDSGCPDDRPGLSPEVRHLFAEISVRLFKTGFVAGESAASERPVTKLLVQLFETGKPPGTDRQPMKNPRPRSHSLEAAADPSAPKKARSRPDGREDARRDQLPAPIAHKEQAMIPTPPAGEESDPGWFMQMYSLDEQGQKSFCDALHSSEAGAKQELMALIEEKLKKALKQDHDKDDK
ncbi:MAG: hypothetical protein OXC07_02895 [Kistimonas sp.]|nr:hypothetical protein [Kistimonas sp.]